VERMSPERTVAGWTLEEHIGSGGFAEVWRASKSEAGLVRALKLVRPAGRAESARALTSWQSEVAGLKRLQHPNIVRFYDAGQVVDGGPYQGYAWIAVELCRQSLNVELRETSERTLPPGECRRLVDQMLDALATAHRQGIVHRDVKPANILLDADGTWKLGDFGIARLVPAGQSHPHTRVAGSTPYLSEAALRGRQDYAADLYALGVTIHEALCGERLHPRAEGMTDAEYHHLILSTPPRIAAAVPPDWRLVVQRLIDAPNSREAAGELSGRLHDGAPASKAPHASSHEVTPSGDDPTSEAEAARPAVLRFWPGTAATSPRSAARRQGRGEADEVPDRRGRAKLPHNRSRRNALAAAGIILGIWLAEFGLLLLLEGVIGGQGWAGVLLILLWLAGLPFPVLGGLRLGRYLGEAVHLGVWAGFVCGLAGLFGGALVEGPAVLYAMSISLVTSAVVGAILDESLPDTT
jgi:eukaryotic-like serine/threonine-protein kinase